MTANPRPIRLQVALDSDLDAALGVLARVHPYVDVLEIGTPQVFREGMAAVRRLRAEYPQHTLLADLKIVDAGHEEAALGFQAGADIVTVLALAPDETVLGALQAARQHGGGVMADMLQVAEPLPRARWLFEHGVETICVHLAHDLQDAAHSPLDGLRLLRRGLPEAGLAVAGGVGPEILPQLASLRPSIVVAGKAITQADDPALVARLMREILDRE